MKKTFFLIFLLIFTALQAWALYDGWTDDFGPFRDDEKIARVALRVLDTLESSQTDTTQVQKRGLKDDTQAPVWLIQTDSKDPKNLSTLFQIMRNKSKKPLRFEVPGKNFTDIYTADLNGDGLPDYLLTLNNPSIGGADDEGDSQDGYSSKNLSFIVLLSVKKTYRIYLVEKARMPDTGVCKIGPQLATCLLHTTDFTEPKLSLPAETHVVFHLYQLLSVNGAELHIDNGLDLRFPKFVAQDMGASHKNHKETKLLTDSRKKELINLYQPVITELHFKK